MRTPSCKPLLPNFAAEMSSPFFPMAVSAAFMKNFLRACGSWRRNDESLVKRRTRDRGTLDPIAPRDQVNPPGRHPRDFLRSVSPIDRLYDFAHIPRAAPRGDSNHAATGCPRPRTPTPGLECADRK